MAENKLEIILSAKTAGIEKSLSQVDARVRQTAKGISSYLSESGEGAKGLQDALESVEFSGLADSAKAAAKDIKGAFSKSGDDLDQAFKQADGAKKISKEFQDAKEAVSEFSAEARKDLQSVEKATDDVKEAVNEVADAFNAEQLRAGAQQLSTDISVLTAGFTQAGEEARVVDRELRKAFTSRAEADKFADTVKKLKGQFEGLEADEIVLAIKRMQAFGIATEKNLQLIANAAQATGKSMDDLADPIGEFLASAKSGQDLGAFEELRALIGVGAEALKPFGAQLDANNKLLGNTRAQIKAANDALIAYLGSNQQYTDVSKRSQDNIGEATAKLDEFNTSVGEQVNLLKDKAAGALLEYLDKLNALSDGQKAAIGVGAEFATTGATVGAKALEIAAFAKLAGVSFGGVMAAGLVKAKTAALAVQGAITALGAGSLAMGSGVLVAAAGLATIAKTAYDAAKATQDLEKAEQSLIATQSLAVTKTKEYIKFRQASVAAIKAETDAIEDSGKRRAAITAAILQKQDAADAARRSGDSATVKRINEELVALSNLRGETDKQISAEIAADKAAVKSKEERFAQSQEAFRKFKEELGRGLFDSNKAALQSLDGLIGGLSGEDLKAAQDERRNLNQAILADEVDSLKERVQANKVSAAESKGILEDLERQYEAHGENKKSIDKDYDEFLKGLQEEAAARTRAIIEEEANLKRSAIALNRDALSATDDEIEALEAKLEKGQDVTKELERELKGRAENQKRLLDQEAALDRIAIKQKANADAAQEPDKGNREKIYQQAAERERQLDQATAQQKAAIDRQLAKDQAAAVEKRAAAEKEAALKKADMEKQYADLSLQQYDQQRAAQDQAFADRRQQLEQEVALGANRTAAIAELDKQQAAAQKKAIEDRAKLEIDAINKAKAASDIGATTEQKKLNALQAQLAIQKVMDQASADKKGIVDQSLQALKDETAEMVKQLALLQEQNKELDKKNGFDSTFATGAQSVEDAFGANNSGLGVSRRNRAKTEDGKSAEDLERDIKRNQGIINSRENTAKRDGSAPGRDGEPPAGAAVPAVPTGPIPTIPNTAEMGMLAKMDNLTKLMAQLVSIASRTQSNTGSSFSRGANRVDGIT